MNIGPYTISPAVILAPMAGYSDALYRSICHEFGAAAGITELISAKALQMGQQKTISMIDFFPSEQPRWLQIFGSQPEVMAYAARVGQQQGAQIIDINMGCPVRKVISIGAGAALMKDISRAAAIVHHVCNAVDIPVTAKIRSGWDNTSIVAPDMASALVDAGVSAITVHGRTRSQAYAGIANWDIIKQVVTMVGSRVTVIGNGDVKDGVSAKAMIEKTGCHAVMVGRAAMGNPWVFADITRNDFQLPTMQERIHVAMDHLIKHVKQYDDEQHGVMTFRTRLVQYLKGFPGASKLRGQLCHCGTISEIESLLRL